MFKLFIVQKRTDPRNICLFKVNNRNTRKKIRNMFKVNNEDTRANSVTSGICLLGMSMRAGKCLLGNYVPSRFFLFDAMVLQSFCNFSRWLIEGGSILPACIFLLKVNNRNTRTRCEKSSKLAIKTPERLQWRHSGVFIVNFEHILHLFLVFLLITLNM